MSDKVSCAVLLKLRGVIAVGDWQWRAECPVCRRPTSSLMIQGAPGNNRVVLKCASGCDPKVIEARLLEVIHQ